MASAAIQQAAINLTKAYFTSGVGSELVKPEDVAKARWEVVQDYAPDSASGISLPPECVAKLGARPIKAPEGEIGSDYIPPAGWRILLVDGVITTANVLSGTVWYNPATGQVVSVDACIGGGAVGTARKSWVVPLVSAGALFLWYLYRRG